MNNAKRIIAKFGSQSALADLIGKGQSTVQHWAKTGRIPAKWQSTLIDLANQQGLDLSPSDFIEKTPLGVAGDDPSLPVAKWPGKLPIFDREIQVYVLSDERRVISRSEVIYHLTDKKEFSGNLEKFVGVKALQGYLPSDISDQMIEFVLPGVVNRTVKGVQAETFLDICKAFVAARDGGETMTATQLETAKRANAFLSAVAKVGLIAMIDEVTGFQYERAQDALTIKLKLFLEEEMREWEKTFPDELWKEFGRLTNWEGGIHSRPKYWGRLVMELVYENLDRDVAAWLKENAPKPMKGRNYHQWLSDQYGLKKLTEHIWMLVGMAKACHTMPELRQKVAEHFGKKPVQLTLYLPTGPTYQVPGPKRQK